MPRTPLPMKRTLRLLRLPRMLLLLLRMRLLLH
jgi:hypothetical protein